VTVTDPREHCGALSPQTLLTAPRTECVLRPGHSGSHADEVGCRWWPIADEQPAAPAGPAPATDRAALSAKLWQIAEHHIVAEWICCEPLNPKHDLCAKGYAALGMVKTLLVDGDPEKAWNPQAPLLDLVLSLLPAPTDQTAVARVRALHQPMERGPFTICAHCSGWDGKWRCLGVVTDYPCPTVRALDGEPAREAQQDPTQDDTLPAGPWEISYHQMSPARLNPGVCICGLGPAAVVHNEPPHACSSRLTAPHQVPVAGLCTLCHHHETAACHTPTAVARPGQPETDEETRHEPVGVVAAAEAGEPPACSCGAIVWCDLRKPST
jgi:hypothetical protein